MVIGPRKSCWWWIGVACCLGILIQGRGALAQDEPKADEPAAAGDAAPAEATPSPPTPPDYYSGKLDGEKPKWPTPAAPNAATWATPANDGTAHVP